MLYCTQFIIHLFSERREIGLLSCKTSRTNVKPLFQVLNAIKLFRYLVIHRMLQVHAFKKFIVVNKERYCWNNLCSTVYHVSVMVKM